MFLDIISFLAILRGIEFSRLSVMRGCRGIDRMAYGGVGDQGLLDSLSWGVLCISADVLGGRGGGLFLSYHIGNYLITSKYYKNKGRWS